MNTGMIVKTEFAASSFSTSLEFGSMSIGDSTRGESEVRMEIISTTAIAVSLVVKSSAAVVLASGMLLPKTGSTALTANTVYTLHHAMLKNRFYAYTLSNTGVITGQVTEYVEGQFYT